MKHRLPLRTPEEKARARAWIDKAPVGWSVTFQPPTRSTDQNRRLWAFLDDIAEQKDWHGRKLSSDAFKDLFTACLRGQELVPNLDGNGFVALGARTSEMSPEEMSDLLALVEAWGADNGGNFTHIPEAPSGLGDGCATAADGSGLAVAHNGGRK